MAATNSVAAQGEAKVSLYASGSEVEIAVAARNSWRRRHRDTGGVGAVPRAAAGAAGGAAAGHCRHRPGQARDRGRSPFGWECRDRAGGIFIGMSTFGASGPAKDLYKHFGITAEAAVEAASKRLQGN